MTKNYLKKFIKYAKKVYYIEDGLKSLKDDRKNPLYTTGEAILPVFLGFLLRIQSFNELKYKIKSGDFINIISRKMKLSQIDYQLEHPVECSHRYKATCSQCLYNVGSVIPICTKTE